MTLNLIAVETSRLIYILSVILVWLLKHIDPFTAVWCVGAVDMESGGIVRTIILTALFVVLVCDYTTLLTQLYESVASSNESRTIFVDGDESGTGDSTLDILQSPSSFREDKTEMDLEADIDFSKLNLFGKWTFVYCSVKVEDEYIVLFWLNYPLFWLRVSLFVSLNKWRKKS